MTFFGGDPSILVVVIGLILSTIAAFVCFVCLLCQAITAIETWRVPFCPGSFFSLAKPLLADGSFLFKTICPWCCNRHSSAVRVPTLLETFCQNIGVLPGMAYSALQKEKGKNHFTNKKIPDSRNPIQFNSSFTLY